MPLSWIEIERFFCEGAAKTFAAGSKPIEPPPIPGAKYYEHRRDNLLYADCYFARRSGENDKINLSGGNTIITLNGLPIWMMSYDGWHYRQDGVRDFLVEALLQNYSNGIFVGGRGPRIYSSDKYPSYMYLNHVLTISEMPEELSYISTSFMSFSGEDYISDRKIMGCRVYCHRYRGKALVQALP